MTSLKALRLERGKTAREVAEAVGVSERTLRRLESGQVELRPIHAFALATYYKVDVSKIDEARS